MQPLYEYVCHIKGNRNSKGELAEWVIKSHETGKILSSHKSEKKAKEHLQQMHIFKESVDSMSYKLLGESTNGNTMDKRFNIFMENVAKLGLSKNQFEAVGNITKVCLEGSFGKLQEPDVDEMGDVYSSQYKSSHLSKRSNVRYADFLKLHDDMEAYGDVGPIKKYKMPLIDTDTNKAHFVNYDSIPEATDGNSWGFRFGYHDGFNYSSSKYIWVPRDAFDKSVPLEKEGADVGCIGEMSSNSRENILGIRRDQTYDDFMLMYKKASALAAREPNEYKVSKLQRYSTPEFNPLSVKAHHMSFDSIKPDENGNILGFEEHHRPGHPFQVVTKILWLPANTEEPEDKTPSDEDIYSALYPDEAPTYGGRVRTSEEEYDPDNPGDPDEDYYNEHENEWDPENRDDDEIEF